MAEYKCIACGYVKESKKDCTCPECGYKMFPLPYNRKKILADEIQKFIKSLMIEKIEDVYFSYYRDAAKSEAPSENEETEYEDTRIYKSTDDERFPIFCEIQSYICSADKTEKFVERLNATLNQIEKHVSTPYQMEYQTDFGYLSTVLDGYEDEL